MSIRSPTEGGTLLLGDCRDVMHGLEPDSVDAIVTDPPYEIGFMGKAWDQTRIAYDVGMWREALRVLKPGGHLLAFGGARTYHRLACAIEDAGFEIRDQVMWIYGSSFPKSRNVSKAIDVEAGAEREIIGFRNDNNRNCPKHQTTYGSYEGLVDVPLTAPATEAARQWQGWGTALKPAHEPLVLARKPLVGTVAGNVLEFGTGALNIDGCRVPGGEPWKRDNTRGKAKMYDGWGMAPNVKENTFGARWPANVIHDGSDEVEAAFAAFGEKKGFAGQRDLKETASAYFGAHKKPGIRDGFGDTGTASRFFYCAKASKADRDDGLECLPEIDIRNIAGGALNRGQTCSDGSVRTAETPKRRNTHPTVKPTELMQYLCRLITPPGGTVLDPFMGSGSTGRGAVLEGFRFIGIEIDADYVEIARLRIAAARSDPKKRPKANRPAAALKADAQLPLFAALA